MADPVLQQVQNLCEPADIPYEESHNVMNTIGERHTRQTKPKRQRNQKLIVSPGH